MKLARILSLVVVLLSWGIFLPVEAADPMRGLWVGEVRLTYATEVTVPLDENNIPRAPDPERPTRTFDVANILLLLHVNGSGQVSLLKEVAILKRTDGILANENDFSLVTDPRLFADYPSQPARRIASVVFDFGDQKATDAVQAVMDAAVEAAANSINGGGSLTDAENAAESAAQAVVDNSDAEERFNAFIMANLSSTQVDTIATSGDATAARTEAETLRDGSFYADGRGVVMVDAILAAVAAAATTEEKEAAAQNTASAFADVDNEYHRFLAGKIFGDLITGVSREVAGLAVLRMVQSYSGTAGSQPVEINSPGHGLSTDDTIVISGAGIDAYNGGHIVTKTGDDTFTVPVNYVAGGAITSYGGANGSPLQVNSAAHGLANGDRVIISNAPVAAYNGEKTVMVLSSDSFSIGVTRTTDTGGPGRWDPVEGGAWKSDSAALADAADNVPEQNDAEEEAIQIKVAGYGDSRGDDAIDAVVNAIINAGAASSLVSPGTLEKELVEAGFEALATAVMRYPLPEMAPTGDYNDFVRAANTQLPENFQTSPSIAAAAAAQAAFDERENNSLSTDTSVRNAALVGAANALENVFAAAARAIRTELPMDGVFAVGEGDPRFKGELDPGDDLGLPAITGTVVLPAMHPTNPFRHRRHPDHTVGFDIVRKLRLDFDGEPGDTVATRGFGVNVVTGTYREEVTKPENRAQGGLHKPLGPNQDRGLTVEGKFELNRISLIDTLNAK